MFDLNEINNSLNSNPYLTIDIKENFMELISIFNKNFPNVDLSNLNERLKTLKVLRGSKFLLHGDSTYDPISNEILISLTKITDNSDCKHILMREILNIITAKDNYTGFNINNEYEALNIGYTEILTNFLVGNEEDSFYEDEIIEADLMAKLIGKDKIYNAYFNNDINIILDTI